MERVMGVEPTSEAWEAPVLPMNYTRERGKSSTCTPPAQGGAIRDRRVRAGRGAPWYQWCQTCAQSWDGVLSVRNDVSEACGTSIGTVGGHSCPPQSGNTDQPAVVRQSGP